MHYCHESRVWNCAGNDTQKHNTFRKQMAGERTPFPHIPLNRDDDTLYIEEGTTATTLDVATPAIAPMVTNSKKSFHGQLKHPPS